MTWNRWLTWASASVLITGLLSSVLPLFVSATLLFQRTLLPALLLQMALAGWAAWQVLAESGKPARTTWMPWIWMGVVALAGTLWIAGGVPAEFRVLADETNLLGSALSMSLNGGIDNITQGVFYYDTYHVLEAGAPARPILFPALTAAAHLILGYSAHNGFIVNLFACFFTLLGVAEAGRRLGSLSLGLIGAGLLAGHPLFQLYVRASGFEAVNLMMMTWTLVAMVAVAERPTTRRWEAALWMATLAAQCRYESIVLIGPVVLLAWVHRKSLLEQTWSPTLWLAPLSLVPLMWQRRTTSVINPGDKIDSPFGLKFIPEHLRNAVEFFFDPKHTKLPTSVFFAVMIIAGAALALRRIKDWRQRPTVIAFALFALGVGVIFATHMAYYLGDLRAPFITRYALSYLPPLALLGALPLARMGSLRGARYAVACVLLLHVATGVVQAAENEHGSKLTLFREYKQVLDTLAELRADRMLIVADRPGMYTAHRFSAIKGRRANDEADRYVSEVNRHLYDGMVAIQQVHYKDGAALPELSSKFDLQTIREFQNTAEYYVRVSIMRPNPAANPVVKTVDAPVREVPVRPAPAPANAASGTVADED